MIRLFGFGRNHPRLAATAVGLIAVILTGGLYLNTASVTEAQQPNTSKGASVYVNNCQVCHGAMGQGGYGPPLLPRRPNVVALPRDAQVQGLTGLLRRGIDGRMPSFSADKMSDGDVGDLVDWLNAANSNLPEGRRFIPALARVGEVPSTGDRLYFGETGHTVSYAFKRHWESTGGLRTYGFPISEEYLGFSESDGKWVTMQMFERARFEYRDSGVSTALLGSEQTGLRIYSLTSRGRTP